MSIVRRTGPLPVAIWTAWSVAAWFFLLTIKLPHCHLSADGEDCLVSDEDGSCSSYQISKGVSATPPTVERLVQSLGTGLAALWIRTYDVPSTFRIVRSVVPRAPPLLV